MIYWVIKASKLELGENRCIIGYMINIENLKISNNILNLIAKIDEFKGSWKALGTLAPERLLALRRVATIESIGSSTRIEGSKLSDQDVEQLLSKLQINTFETRDEQEVSGYAHTMELIFKSWQHITVTENHIQQLHRDLLKNSAKDSHHRGKYKTTENSVAAFDEEGKQIGIVFKTASPFDTPQLMKELIEFANLNMNSKELHPLLTISIFIVVFLEIHPFQDGNGRLSRILTTLLLLQAGYIYIPYSSLESIIERNKEEYYLSLRQTQKTIRSNSPKWESWILFFLKALHKQTIHLSKKIDREKLILESFPELSIQILEHVTQHGRVTIGQMSKLTGKSRNTLKEHFRTLVKQNHLKLYGAGRGAWYGRV